MVDESEEEKRVWKRMEDYLHCKLLTRRNLSLKRGVCGAGFEEKKKESVV